MQSIRKVLAALRRADERYSLIQEGDRIAVGLSGGKDSLCLLKALAIYRRFGKKNFALSPFSLDLGFTGYNPAPIEEYCSSLGLKLHVIDARFVYSVLLEKTKPGKHISCSICARMKKAASLEAAKSMGCNKMAFAHHQDDALETLFLNMAHSGRIGTFLPKMELSGILFIRPLCLAKEDDLRRMAQEENLPVQPRICPADGKSDRAKVKDTLSKVYSLYPQAEKNFRRMLDEPRGNDLFYDSCLLANPEDPSLGLRPILRPADVYSYDALREKDPKRFSLLKNGDTHYLIYQKGRLIGRISHRELDHHVQEITALEGKEGKEKELLSSLRQLLAILKRESVPLTVLYMAKGKALAKKAGFAPRKMGSKNEYRLRYWE